MIRIEWFCKRCGSPMRTEEYNFKPGYDGLSGTNITEDICENCLCEYEALKCRQSEERRMFWEEWKGVKNSGKDKVDTRI